MALDLAGFCRLIWKRRWQIALLVAFAMVASFAGIKLTKPVYQATARILIQEELPKDRYSFLYQRKQGSYNLIPNCVEILKGFGGQVAGTVRVQPIQGTDIIMVSVDATDPREAVKGINTLLEGLRLNGQGGGASGEKGVSGFVASEIDRVEDQLARASDEVRTYRNQFGIIRLSDDAKALVERLSLIGRLRAEVDLKVREARFRLDELERDMTPQERTTVSVDSLFKNSEVSEYRSALAELQIELAQLLEVISSDSPLVASFYGRIGETENRLFQAVARLLSTHTAPLNGFRKTLVQQAGRAQAEAVASITRRDALDALIHDAERQITLLPLREQELVRRMEAQSVLQDTATWLHQRAQAYYADDAAFDVKIVNPATLPDRPVNAGRSRTVLAVALFLGLFAGCGLAVVLEYFDPTLKTGRDVQEYLGLPVIGVIPAPKQQSFVGLFSNFISHFRQKKEVGA